MSDNKKSYDQVVAENIIEALKNGTAPWTKPWSGAEISDIAPRNLKTGRFYEGVNFINLMIESMNRGYSDPRWLTFAQGKEIGANVKKGERSSVVKFYIFPKKDDEKSDKKEELEAKKDKPKVVYHRVFNASQFENIEPFAHKIASKIDDFQTIMSVDQILKNSGAEIKHLYGDSAYYNTKRDHIVLPEKWQFKNEMAYYGTALHELGHWSGHSSRLDRDLSGHFGSESYAKEELRAEISAFMTSSKLGLDFDPSRNHSYIASWIKVIEDDNKEILRASRDALKISNFVMDFAKNEEINIDNSIENMTKNIEKISKKEERKEIKKIDFEIEEEL